MLSITHNHVTHNPAPQLGRSYSFEITQARQWLSLQKKRSKLGPAAERVKKVRDVMTRRTQREIPGYTWTMGYNNCVGRYSQGRSYGRFSGSSLNRSLKNIDDAKDLYTTTANLIEACRKLAVKMSGIPQWAVSVQIRNFFSRPCRETAEEYCSWVRRHLCGDVDGLSFGIHMLSPRSRGKIRDKATAFYRSCPGSRVFLTLTFIAPVDDQTGVTILNKFLTSIRKKMQNVNYLWVAERQTSNPETPDNIHFHVIINKRLPVRQYNGLWVQQQYNAGLRGKTKYGEQISQADIDRRVKDGTVGKVLNPMDVKKISSIGGLSGYLTKYITKQQKDVPFGCSVWHCSRSVSRLFTRSTVSPSSFRYCMTLANCRVDKKTGEVFEPQMIRGDFFVMVYINNKSAPLKDLKEMEIINKWLITGLMPDRLPMCDDDDYRKHFLCQN